MTSCSRVARGSLMGLGAARCSKAPDHDKVDAIQKALSLNFLPPYSPQHIHTSIESDDTEMSWSIDYKTAVILNSNSLSAYSLNPL